VSCADETQPGVAAITEYLDALPYPAFRGGNCEPGSYYVVTNNYPSYQLDGSLEYDIRRDLTLAYDASFDERDYEDGALDLLALGEPPLEAVCAVKALAQWLATGLPLALAAPVASLMLGAPVAMVPVILLCALVGGLAFAFVGGLGAALTLGSRRGGVLIAVIVLPLFAPPVIFGGGALSQAASGMGGTSGLLLLCGWAAAAVALSPLAMAAACRNALD